MGGAKRIVGAYVCLCVSNPPPTAIPLLSFNQFSSYSDATTHRVVGDLTVYIGMRLCVFVLRAHVQNVGKQLRVLSCQ